MFLGEDWQCNVETQVGTGRVCYVRQTWHADTAVLSSAQTHGQDKSILKSLRMLAILDWRVSRADKGEARWSSYAVLSVKTNLGWNPERNKKNQTQTKQATFCCLHKGGIWPWMPWVSTGNIHDCEQDDSYMQQNSITKENNSNGNCIIVRQSQIIYLLLY